MAPRISGFSRWFFSSTEIKADLNPQDVSSHRRSDSKIIVSTCTKYSVLGSVGFLICNSVVGVGDDLKRRRRKDGHSDSKIRRWVPSSTPVASHDGNYLLIIYQTRQQGLFRKGYLERGSSKLTFQQ